MIWATFCFNGHCADISDGSFSVECKQPKNTCRHWRIMYFLLKNFLLVQWVFKQDNAQKHKARIKTRWLNLQQIKVFDRPSCRTDFKTIENLWSIMTRKVYKNNWHYSSRDDHKAPLKNALFEIYPEIMQNLNFQRKLAYLN